MYGLPQRTETNKPLHKTKVFEKFAFSAPQREAFDADVSRMVISHVIAESTIPTIKAGKEITDFYVVTVQMKKFEYDAKNITLLTKLIPRKILFILQYEEYAQLAVYHTKLICSEWKRQSKLEIPLLGFDLDAVWENIITSVGSITIQEGNTLDEQIKSDEQRARLQQQIQSLQKRMNKEKQYNRQLELNAEIKKLKKQLEEIK